MKLTDYFPDNGHFIGCDSDFASSAIVVFGAGYDGTTSNRPGARFAGKAMRSESFGIETYSPYCGKDLTDYGICDCGEIELPFGAPEPVLDIITSVTDQILLAGKIPVMIGGEHLVTYGAFRAVKAKYPDICIVHFDAHADLREDYLGQRLSHATVMRRCYDLIGDGRLFQFGIRSGDKAEFAFAAEHTYLQKFKLSEVDQLNRLIGMRPVYFTIDLDVLDSGVFPATGTPEAGGVSFDELYQAMERVCALNIVAADVCELSPPYDATGVSTALACKVLRELLLLMSKG
jgi:agmatinase